MKEKFERVLGQYSDDLSDDRCDLRTPNFEMLYAVSAPIFAIQYSMILNHIDIVIDAPSVSQRSRRSLSDRMTHPSGFDVHFGRVPGFLEESLEDLELNRSEQ